MVYVSSEDRDISKKNLGVLNKNISDLQRQRSEVNSATNIRKLSVAQRQQMLKGIDSELSSQKEKINYYQQFANAKTPDEAYNEQYADFMTQRENSYKLASKYAKKNIPSSSAKGDVRDILQKFYKYEDDEISYGKLTKPQAVKVQNQNLTPLALQRFQAVLSKVSTLTPSQQRMINNLTNPNIKRPFDKKVNKLI